MKIQVTKGTFDDTCTVSSNLTENQVKFPAIRDVIQYSEQRMLSTLIVSGAQDMQAVGKIKTKIGNIPADKLIGDAAYRYPVMGRIQIPSEIIGQVGASDSKGGFQLQMKDNYLVPGMVALFHGNGLLARVQGQPTSGGVYSFQTMDGTVFDYSIHVAPQQGSKTCFGSYTAYGQKSLRGYGRSHYPDMFVNHLGIQRKTIGMSGGALSDVLWVQFNGQKGWMFTKERQARLQFMMEDEFNKWFSRSTMKDSSGNLLARSIVTDPETGEDVIMGDGIIPQIEGINESYASGSDGNATLDDFRDMMTTLSKKSSSVEGRVWYVVTGTDGYNNAQLLLENKAHNTFNFTIKSEASDQAIIGGQKVDVGYNFSRYNVNGDSVVFVKHPMFDDETRFTERGADGRLTMSSKYIFLDLGMDDQGQQNIEIMSKGAYGVDRTMVSGYINGLTGLKGKDILNSVDGIEFNMLKEDGAFIYNTASCGIINKSAVY